MSPYLNFLYTPMQYIWDVITERRASPAFVRGGLRALSYAFRAGVRLRHLAYERKWLTTVKLPAFVVSVGNIIVGGSGKTPVVQMLARALESRCKTAILTRGFRSEIERSGRVVKTASGGQSAFPPSVCGDEPFWLGMQTRADIWVGRDRVACGKAAIQEGAKCLILDDGMQHRRLARDVEIVVVDAKDPLAKDRFLPRGRLRDLPSRLKTAELIIANHLTDPSREAELCHELKKYTDAPVVGVYVKPLEEEQIRNKRVGVFCGIGNPERFIETLKAVDADIADTLFLLDHCAPKEEQLRRFINACQKKGATRILCTEKDAVKLMPSFQGALPILPVKVQLEISCGKIHWDACLARIADQIKYNRNST